MVPIVMISESLLRRSTASDGRILRDRVLSGFGGRLNAEKRNFLMATGVTGTLWLGAPPFSHLVQ